MKKLSVILLMLLFIVGCQDKVDVEKTNEYASMGFPGISEDGIYHLVQTEFNKEVYFYDFSAKKDIPLCSKVNCNHANEDCDAYRLSYYKDTNMKLNMAPVYYQNRLYYFYENLVKGKTTLCSSDVDGTDLKEITELADMAVIDSAIFFHQKLWYSENAFEVDDKGQIISNGHTYRFQVFDLENGTQKTISEEDGTMLLQRGAMENTVYLSKITEDGDISLVGYDDEMHTLQEPYEMPNAYVIGTNVYGYDTQRNQVYSLDVNTMKKEDVMKVEIPEGYTYHGVQSDDCGIMTIQLAQKDQAVGEMYIDVVHQRIIKGEGKVITMKKDTYYRLDQKGFIIEEMN